MKLQRHTMRAPVDDTPQKVSVHANHRQRRAVGGGGPPAVKSLGEREDGAAGYVHIGRKISRPIDDHLHRARCGGPAIVQQTRSRYRALEWMPDPSRVKIQRVPDSCIAQGLSTG